MKCEKCGQKEATVHEVTIRSGKKVERHLCEACARAEGIPVQSHAGVTQVLQQFINEQIAGVSANTAINTAATTPTTECPSCGTTYAQFRHAGLLGCPDCYAAFESQLGPLLSRAHEGGTHHVGKVPARVSGRVSPRVARAGSAPASQPLTAAPPPALADDRKHRLADLKRQLDEAIGREQYEVAAKLRDEVKQLETDLAPRGGGGGAGETGGRP